MGAFFDIAALFLSREEPISSKSSLANLCQRFLSNTITIKPYGTPIDNQTEVWSFNGLINFLDEPHRP